MDRGQEAIGAEKGCESCREEVEVEAGRGEDSVVQSPSCPLR